MWLLMLRCCLTYVVLIVWCGCFCCLIWMLMLLLSDVVADDVVAWYECWCCCLMWWLMLLLPDMNVDVVVWFGGWCDCLMWMLMLLLSDVVADAVVVIWCQDMKTFFADSFLPSLSTLSHEIFFLFPFSGFQFLNKDSWGGDLVPFLCNQIQGAGPEIHRTCRFVKANLKVGSQISSDPALNLNGFK